MRGSHAKDTATSGDVFYVCQRCTNCCKWPGDVCLEEDEVDVIAAFLNLDVAEFTERYTRLRANRVGLSLIEKVGTTECVMLDGANCRLQDVKPGQCRGFPNTWNFPGWQKVCEAKPVPMNRAQEQTG
jgi:Fe-S-cluster containining protein